MLEISVTRVLVMRRTFTPNCSVCLPLVQATSSSQLYTGIWNLRVKDVVGETEPTLGCRSSKVRKVTMGRFSFPLLSWLCRVSPKRKLFTKVLENVAV